MKRKALLTHFHDI